MIRLQESKFLRVLTSLIIGLILIMIYYFFDDSTKIYTISKLAVVVFAISLICYVVKAMCCKSFKKRIPKAGQSIIQVLDAKAFLWPVIANALIITSIFVNPFFQSLIDYHKLSKEPFGGTYAYYVVAKSKTEKEYTLPAEVHISYSEDSRTTDSIIGEMEESFYQNSYIIKRIYFKNGGYLYFEDGIEFNKPTEIQSCIDQNENSWDIKLTDKHTNFNLIKEQNPFNKKDGAFYALTTVLALVQCILWLIYI